MAKSFSDIYRQLKENALPSRKKIDELHAPYETPHKSTLGAMEVRQARHEKQGNQERKPTDYKATNEKKEVAVKKNQTVINTEPENNSPIAGY